MGFVTYFNMLINGYCLYFGPKIKKSFFFSLLAAILPPVPQ